jgi:hypothetical protein
MRPICERHAPPWRANSPEAQTISAGKYDVFIAPMEQFML